VVILSDASPMFGREVGIVADGSSIEWTQAT